MSRGASAKGPLTGFAQRSSSSQNRTCSNRGAAYRSDSAAAAQRAIRRNLSARPPVVHAHRTVPERLRRHQLEP